MMDPDGIVNCSVTHVDWSEGKWHLKVYRAKDVTFDLLKNITSIDMKHQSTDEQGEEECAQLPDQDPLGSTAAIETGKEKDRPNTHSEGSSNSHPKRSKPGDGKTPTKMSGRTSSSDHQKNDSSLCSKFARL